MSKSWSYKQFTDLTEQELRGYATFLESQLIKQELRRDKHLVRTQIQSWAQGALHLWDRMTQGWQKIGDRERLQVLVDAMGEASTE